MHVQPSCGHSAVLYVSYDGMLEPLGQSQVLAYQERLAVDREIHLLSFEKAADWRDGHALSTMRQRLRDAGIRWHPRRYHKRPSALATAYDIAVGTLSAAWICLRYRIGIVHARSYVAAAMSLPVRALTGARFVFDMRGFWADERVDGGLWPAGGRLYRAAKWLERRALLGADHVVSLTQAGVRELRKFDYLRDRMPAISVISTCADLDRFRPGSAKGPGFILGYVGSAGTWYLFDALVECFAQLRILRPEARLLVVNRGEHAFIRERLAAAGIPVDAVELRAATHAEVPELMTKMHATAFFIKPVFSKQASAPTKLAEFLGCGVPCLVNAGVGDMQEIVESEGVGIAVEAMDAASLHNGLLRLLELVADENIAARCVHAAQRRFSLERGVAEYRAIYERLDGTAT